ncbi:hypothetical protein BAUCODRAFT_38963 [Baudoinia panamericana UAMH 10762]|uniref:Uncharacterized protein n=1 Tax=Baudoinia panamericana (strain UAMH 10762) TaxID=717646 RepID=M2MYS7_BAUPA|nr:uncharacterized protein BAUCODRAFT_38963 [Baudoinia panamericana UAMH 10762]EMC91829.1 hypothetical protein BAUCODRAFT_38963 [Baudoinia panamericana UAMH 10762]
MLSLTRANIGRAICRRKNRARRVQCELLYLWKRRILDLEDQTIELQVNLPISLFVPLV